MALFGFLKKNKTVTCAQCGDEIKESEARQLYGKNYCSYCYNRRSRAAEPVKEKTTTKAKTVDSVKVTSSSGSAGATPAIKAIDDVMTKGDIKHRVEHIGDQWEIAAGINGKGCTYTLKFINKDHGKGDVAIRVFGLASCPAKQEYEARVVLNELQRQYRYVRFNMDKDMDINLEYDLPSCTEDIGAIALEMFLRILKIIDDSYPKIMKAVWG